MIKSLPLKPEDSEEMEEGEGKQQQQPHQLQVQHHQQLKQQHKKEDEQQQHEEQQRQQQRHQRKQHQEEVVEQHQHQNEQQSQHQQHKQQQEEYDPRARVVSNHLILRRIFAHLPGAAALSRCARVLPLGTEWGAAAAAAAEDRGRAAPALFCCYKNGDGPVVEENGKGEEEEEEENSKRRQRLRRALRDFSEVLPFLPGLAVCSSSVLASELSSLWPYCPVVPVCPTWNYVPGKLGDGSGKYSALLFPRRGDVQYVPFQLRESDALATGKPILPSILKERQSTKDIKALLVFARVKEEEEEEEISFHSPPRLRWSTPLWLERLLREVDVATGGGPVPLAGHEAKFPSSVDKSVIAHGVLFLGPGVEAASAASIGCSEEDVSRAIGAMEEMGEGGGHKLCALGFGSPMWTLAPFYSDPSDPRFRADAKTISKVALLDVLVKRFPG